MIQHTAAYFERQYQTSPESLALARILYALFIITRVVPLGDKLIGLPDNAYKPPPGLPEMLGGIPSPSIIITVNTLILLLAGMLLIGWRTRITSFLLGVTLTVAFAIEYSSGKIDHTITLVLVPLAMSLSDWGSRYSIDAKRATQQPLELQNRANLWSARALVLLGLAMGLAFFSAAYFKVQTGWLDLDTSCTLGHAVRNVVMTGREPLLFDTLVRVMPLWTWELLDWATILFEAGIVLAIIRRTLFRWVLVIAIGFHVSVYLTLAIGFTSTLAGYMMFVSWAVSIPAGIQNKITQVKAAIPLATAGLLVTASGLCALFAQTDLLNMVTSGFDGLILLIIATGIAGIWVFQQLRRPFTRRANE